MRFFFSKKTKHKENSSKPKLSLDSCAVPAPPDTLDYHLDPWAFNFQYHERYSEAVALKEHVVEAINEIEELNGKVFGVPRLLKHGDTGLSTVRQHLRHLTLHELPHFSARVESFHAVLLAHSWGAYRREGDKLTSAIKELSDSLKRSYPMRESEFLKHLRNLYEVHWLLEFKNDRIHTAWMKEENDGFADIRYLMADLALGREAPAEEWLSALAVLRRHYEGKLTQESEASVMELLDSAEVFFILRQGVAHAPA